MNRLLNQHRVQQGSIVGTIVVAAVAVILCVLVWVYWQSRDGAKPATLNGSSSSRGVASKQGTDLVIQQWGLGADYLDLTNNVKLKVSYHPAGDEWAGDGGVSFTLPSVNKNLPCEDAISVTRYKPTDNVVVSGTAVPAETKVATVVPLSDTYRKIGDYYYQLRDLSGTTRSESNGGGCAPGNYDYKLFSRLAPVDL